MIVRKIRPEEYKRVLEFCALAFQFKLEGANKTSEELIAECEAHPTHASDVHWRERWAAFEDDDKTMLSTIGAIPYTAHFDTAFVPMVGIGAVATLPPYRRRGGIRACFEKALPDMYQQGAVLSYLYPFSTAYYRKFGYELACEQNSYKLLLSGLPKVDVGGFTRLLEPSAPLLEDIRAIDKCWQSRYNLFIVEGDAEYSWVTRANPFTDMEYTFVYYAPSGEPSGYLTFALQKESGDRCMRCKRFVFSDPQGFYGLLNLLLSHAADYRYALLSLPVDVELTALLPEWSLGVVSCVRGQNGMVRVINVEKALWAAIPRGSGQLVLRIKDEQIPENNGDFSVIYADGKMKNIERCTAATPDIEMRIQDFSRLITGRFDVSAVGWMKDVVVHHAEHVGDLFYQKPMFITTKF